MLTTPSANPRAARVAMSRRTSGLVPAGSTGGRYYWRGEEVVMVEGQAQWSWSMVMVMGFWPAAELAAYSLSHAASRHPTCGGRRSGGVRADRKGRCAPSAHTGGPAEDDAC